MTAQPDVRQNKSRVRIILRAVRSDWRLALGVTGLGFIVLVAVVSRFWTPHDPAIVVASDRLLPISLTHPLGTDHLGRDIVSQLMVGAWNSIQVGIFGTGSALVVGVVVGGAAAMMGGRREDLLMRLVDVLIAFPAILAAMMLAGKLGAGNATAVIAVAIALAPVVSRITRSAARQVLTRDFITAARAYGRGPVRIYLRHVIPNIGPILIVQATVLFAVAFLAEAALSFLGLGAQPPIPSWGRMLRDAQSYFQVYPSLAIWPGVCIMFTVLSLNFIGDGLRDALSPERVDE
ncbi:MAG: ABC transporter permease [Acidimicrobiia bacterium]